MQTFHNRILAFGKQLFDFRRHSDIYVISTGNRLVPCRNENAESNLWSADHKKKKLRIFTPEIVNLPVKVDRFASILGITALSEWQLKTDMGTQAHKQNRKYSSKGRSSAYLPNG